MFKDLGYSSNVEKIRWTKNSLTLDLPNNKYGEGQSTENCITITSPGEKDIGEYTCIVSNAAGTVSKSVKLGL